MVNSVVLVGRLTDDIELKQTQSGKSVTNFTLAVSRQYDKDKADFISCVAWGKTAEFMQNYLSKGLRIAVEGRIETRNYEAQDGRKVYVTEVIADSVQALEWKKEETVVQEKPKENPLFDIQTSDLPF